MRTATTKAALVALALVTVSSGAATTTAAEGTPPDTTAAIDTSAAAGEAPSLEFIGPNGETPTPASEMQLTDDEVEQVRAGDYTAALVWHENSAFIQAVETGVREEFEELGIEVIASTSV